MRWRSLVGLALLLGYGSASVEAVLGELRDGDVHHETTVEALNHASHDGTGEHGHEDDGAHSAHGPEHEHGTSGDHCTHAHSAGLPGERAQIYLVAQVAVLPAEPAATCSGAERRTPFQPPKA